MGVLSQYIEKPVEEGGAGIATVQVSLIRPVSETVKPPRALWVPFPLGRPLGPPNRPDVQLDVLRRTLGLVNKTAGPVLEDYPDTLVDDTPPEEGWSCPVTFPSAEPTTGAEAVAAQLRTEVQLLRPWFDEGLRTRGRTTVGISGKGVDSIDEMVDILVRFAMDGSMAVPDGYAQSMPELLRLLTADVRAFYSEAAISKPGAAFPDPEALEEWFFLETAAGGVIYQVRERFLSADMLVLMAHVLDDDDIDSRLALLPGTAAAIGEGVVHKPGIIRELLRETALAYQEGLIGRLTRSFVPIAMRDRHDERKKTTAGS